MWWFIVWRGEDNLEELVLSLYHVVPEIVQGLAWLETPLIAKSNGIILITSPSNAIQPWTLNGSRRMQTSYNG